MRKKILSFFLAAAVCLTASIGGVQPVPVAAADGFVEVLVPNGDFESGETAWTFTGDIKKNGSEIDLSSGYYWRLFSSSSMTNNRTNLYEVCSKAAANAEKQYTCSQTVTGLEPGVYKASVEATGGNDPGTHTTTLTAGGKSVNITPNAWNVWNTYTTGTFSVGEEGTCSIEIQSTLKNQYIDLDNVKLWRQTTQEAAKVQVIPADALGSVDLDEDWKFYLATRTPQVAEGGFINGVKDAGEYTTEQIIAKDFDDRSFRTIDVPHDFSIEGTKVASSSDAQAYLQGGLGWYRKRFQVPASLQGKTISIDFEGVYQNSVVYLNGEKIGSYPSGYTGFALDVTSKLKYGAENVLVVKVQNMSPSGRWYTGSGITRPVHLVVDNLVHFTRNGITLSTPNLKQTYTGSKKASLNIEAKAFSDDVNANAYMQVSVYDAEGKQVAAKRTENTAINPSTEFSLSLADANALEVPDVKLWNPWNLGSPYLYKVKLDLYRGVTGGSGYDLVDSEEIEYGFRWVEVAETMKDDPASGGLYINGTYTKIQGVDLHHDSGALGAASYSDAYERQFAKLKDMGVNAYRTSHCPPSKQVIEICRRNGFLVVEEAFDGWGGPKVTYDFGNFFFQEVPNDWEGLKPNGYSSAPMPATNYGGAKYVWSDWVVAEMVNRDKNEPSIIAWSIGNEVRGLGTKPNWYQPAQYDVLDVKPNDMNYYTEAVRLMRDVKAADDTRFVLMGSDSQRSVPGGNTVWGYVNQALDGFGLNYNTAKSVDGLISRFTIGDGTLLSKGSKTFFFESESSSQTSSRGVYLDPQFSNTGINQTPGQRGGSNYDNDFASWTMSNEYGLKKDRDRKSFIGQFIWTGFDYLGEPTPYEIYPVGVSSFGTIDTAGFPKDSFYLYQSQWTEDPMVHLVPQNWDEWQEGETVEVWVNTNLQSAELFLNGTSLGKKSFDEKETAYGKSYYETSEKTTDDRSWGDNMNPGGYSSPGAVLDGDELNSGKLHLTWEVPYEPGTLEVKAYDEDGEVAAEDHVTTSSIPYTILAEASKTVLKADGKSLSYVECTVVDEDGNMVPDADQLVKFSVSGAASIVGVDNGQQESVEIYKYGMTDKNSYSERTAYNGKVLVILKSAKEEGEAVLTISSKDLKPVQIALDVTEDGTGDAPQAIDVNGRAVSVEPVSVTVPTGKTVTLPSAVRVNYTSDAGNYSLMRNVTWGVAEGSTTEGSIDGCELKATATINQDSSMQTDQELATNGTLGANNNIFRLSDLTGEAADRALATASFTGNVNNYPNNMLDGNGNTSWTNAYSRGQSVLLPANNLSRKSDTVTFYWNSRKVMNQISLTFKESEYYAVPSVLKAEYWDGGDWSEAKGQVVKRNPGEPVVIRFMPVYTERIRVYMENATPFTQEGNIEISEASVMFSTEKMDPQIVLNAPSSVQQGEKLSVRAQLANLPEEQAVQEINFALNYDAQVFENPSVVLANGVGGELVLGQKGSKTVYTYTNESGVPETLIDFVVISMDVKPSAEAGAYQIGFTDVSVKDTQDNEIPFLSFGIKVRVKEQADPILAAKSGLKLVMDAANMLKETDYTVEAWQELMKEIALAQNVFNNESATVEEIQGRAAALQSLIRTLKTPGAEEYQELLKKLKEKEKELEALKNAGGSVSADEFEKLKQELEQLKKTVIVTDQKKYTVKRGKSVKIIAVASNGGKLSFLSKNKKVAKVTKKGVVKGVKKGAAKIVISAGNSSKTVTVKVK